MKKAGLPLLLCLLYIQFTHAQWQSPPLPLVDTLQYTITDTIYMSPTGDDANSGNLQNPVKTFDKAASLLPYTATHNYGLVILLQGDYYPTTEMRQSLLEWQNIANPVTRYKNISVMGQGNVVIHGDSLVNPNPGWGLLTVKGSHIFVKNITLKNCQGNGLGFALGREGRYASVAEIEKERAKHILVDQVTIDGARNHGIFAKYVDTVRVQNCEVKGTSQNYQNQLQSNWGGGIKFDFSSNVTCQDNYVHHNFGEGINLALTYNSETFDNVLHDNRASHIYCMNARKAMVRNNLMYTTVFDSTFWTPYNPNKAATGIAIRNEFEWASGFGVGYWTGNNFCSYTYSNGQMIGNCTRRFTLDLCAGPPMEISSCTDSISVYNNVILDAGWAIAINDANVLGLDHFNGERSVFKNIDIHHNTCFGWSGENGSTIRMVSVAQNATDPINGAVSVAENVNIHDNVFLLPSQDTAHINFFVATHPQEFHFDHNVWNGDPENGNYDGDSTTFANAVQVNYFPNAVAHDSLDDLNPTHQADLWIASAITPGYLTFDHFYEPRNSFTNVGALEYQDTTTHTEGPLFSPSDPQLFAYPNPGNGKLNLSSTAEIHKVLVFNANGQVLKDVSLLDAGLSQAEIDLGPYPSGIYFLVVQFAHKSKNIRVIKE